MRVRACAGLSGLASLPPLEWVFMQHGCVACFVCHAYVWVCSLLGAGAGGGGHVPHHGQRRLDSDACHQGCGRPGQGCI